MIRPWYFFLHVDFSSVALINGKKFYPTKFREGVLIIHADGTIHCKSKECFEDNLNEE